jgi:hypothetical protein
MTLRRRRAANVGANRRKGAIEDPEDGGVIADPDRLRNLGRKTVDIVIVHAEVFDVGAEIAKKQGFIRNDHVFAATPLKAISQRPRLRRHAAESDNEQ